MSFTSTLRQLFGSTPGPGPSRVRNQRGSGASRRVQSRKMTLESLERREVFSTDLLFALAIGNDTGSSLARDVASDSAGNSYMAGSFSGTVDFDPASNRTGDTDILTSRGVSDAYVAKYAPDNSLIWAIRMGGDLTTSADFGPDDTASSLSVDSSGNVYVVGNFKGSSDFGSKTLTTAGDLDAFVVKLNSSGAVQWANRWGGIDDERGQSVGVDGNGNVLALSTKFRGNGTDILKFNPSGGVVWSKYVDASSISNPYLAVDSAGNVVVVGTFSGHVDFDPGPRTNWQWDGAGSSAGYVLSLNSQGNFRWVSVFQGPVNSLSSAADVALDSTGNIVVGGIYRGQVDFNPGRGITRLTSGGFESGGAYVTKLNSNGGLIWARSLDRDGTSFNGVSGLAIGAGNSIFVTGSFDGTTDFDPGTSNVSRTTAGDSDGYLLNLTSAGNFGWVETFGGTQRDAISGVSVDPSGTIHLAGFFSGTVDLPGLGEEKLTSPGTFRTSFLVRLRRR